jgi:hypothetical protein
MVFNAIRSHGVDLRYKVEQIPGEVAVTFPEDHRIDLAFLDSTTGQILVDRSGDKSVLMSTLLAAMPPDVLTQFVTEVAPRMVSILEGLG